MSKEAPFSVIDRANEIVNEKEDRDVADMFANVEMMEKRDKGSHTLRTHQEYLSAEARLSRELDRLSPDNVIYEHED